MSANNAVLVVTERKNSGDAGVPCPIAGVPTAEGVLVLGVSDGLGSLLSSSGEGTMTFGKAETAGTIQTQSKGSQAFGLAQDKGIIATEVDGSSAFGVATGFSGVEPTIIQSQVTGNGRGAQAFGIAEDGGIIGSNGDASQAMGQASGEGATVNTSSSAVGARASGYAGAGSNISSTGIGSESSGFAVGENSSISAQSAGATAAGYASLGGSIQATGMASEAVGFASSGTIVASGDGSQAIGVAVIAGSQILSSGSGSNAFGVASNGYKVKASHDGALAFGVAENESIEANAQGSMAGGFPLAGKVEANGVAAIAYGDFLNAAARLSVALGLGNVNNSYSSIMLGRYGKTTGATPTSWVSTDPLMVLGNGTGITTESNAFEVSKDGRVIEVASKVNKAIKIVSGAYFMDGRADRTLVFDTTTVAGSLTLPAGEDGLEVFVVDGKNNANTNNITVTRSGTDLFQNGNTTDTINTDAGARHYQFKSGVWYVLSKI